MSAYGPGSPAAMRAMNRRNQTAMKQNKINANPPMMKGNMGIPQKQMETIPRGAGPSGGMMNLGGLAPSAMALGGMVGGQMGMRPPNPAGASLGPGEVPSGNMFEKQGPPMQPQGGGFGPGQFDPQILQNLMQQRNQMQPPQQAAGFGQQGPMMGRMAQAMQQRARGLGPSMQSMQRPQQQMAPPALQGGGGMRPMNRPMY